MKLARIVGYRNVAESEDFITYQTMNMCSSFWTIEEMANPFLATSSIAADVPFAHPNSEP